MLMLEWRLERGGGICVRWGDGHLPLGRARHSSHHSACRFTAPVTVAGMGTLEGRGTNDLVACPEKAYWGCSKFRIPPWSLLVLWLFCLLSGKGKHDLSVDCIREMNTICSVPSSHSEQLTPREDVRRETEMRRPPMLPGLVSNEDY